MEEEERQAMPEQPLAVSVPSILQLPHDFLLFWASLHSSLRKVLSMVSVMLNDFLHIVIVLVLFRVLF